VHILTRLALPALWCKFFYGIPYIITEHWSRYLPLRNEFNGKLRKWLTKVAVKHAAMLTTVTENLHEAMLSHGLYNRNTVILPNVVDMDRFKINPQKLNRKIRMVHVSCFEDRSKNITGIINVMARMKLITADFECVMIGDGMDFSYAVNYAKEKGIHTDQLRFTGLLEGDALAKELADADFFLLFSHYENMPVVILEAFACGLPVIATKVGGIPEMVNNSNGMLVSPANEEELLQAILRMMNVYDQYKPEQIRESVALVYGNQAVGKKLSEWYKRVISQ
jgi:glycosyltransferase involved in cell wall biosynthesis